MSHESESNQSCVALDMEKGLHQDKLYLNYPANYMHAPKSAFPSKPPKDKSPSAAEIMNCTIKCK